MALLLALYQKMRITREINELTLRETSISSKQKRIQDNIAKTQKRYTSLITQVGNQAKQMTSMMKIALQNQVGMSYMQANPYTQTSVFSYNYAQQMLAQDGGMQKDNKGNHYRQIGAEEFQAIYNEYQTKGYAGFSFKDADGKDVSKIQIGSYEIDKDDYAAFQMALQAGNQAQSQAQMWVSNATQQMENNVSIWQDAQVAKLEAEQDAALEPLSYEDTMLDLEKTQIESRLEKLRAEKQSYEQLASEESKDSAPKFGLG